MDRGAERLEERRIVSPSPSSSSDDDDAETQTAIQPQISSPSSPSPSASTSSSKRLSEDREIEIERLRLKEREMEMEMERERERLLEEAKPKVVPWRDYTCRRVLKGHTRGVAAVKFSPDGKWVASCCEYLRGDVFFLWGFGFGVMLLCFYISAFSFSHFPCSSFLFCSSFRTLLISIRRSCGKLWWSGRHRECYHVHLTR